MKITFVTDFVCPYCYVAKKALEKAAEKLHIDPEITVQPFELTREPKPRVDTYTDPVRREHYKVLEAPCRDMNLDMKLPPHVIPRPYTRLAFEGRLFACENGMEKEWCEGMYHAYFVEEQDIGNVDVLCSVCRGLGMDDAALRQALESGKYADEEKCLADYSRDVMHIHSVPTIYIDGEEISLSDYSVSEMENILREKKSAGESGFFCGEDGCGFDIDKDER